MTAARVVTMRRTAIKPARKLGDHGTALWNDVMAEYEINDVGGLELLTQACQSLDRAEDLRAQIDADGVTLPSPKGLRDHPCLKHELGARAFMVSTLQKLGLNFEQVKPVGRPGGWRGNADT